MDYADSGKILTDTGNKQQSLSEGTVSVIIPTYNREKYIINAIESVINQRYPRVEVLVCDDFSTDNTKKVVYNYMREHPNVKFLQRPDGHKGANWARNYGIECANGEYIAFLDSDDELLPESIAVRVAILDKHPEIDMVYGDVAVNGKLHTYDYIQHYNQNKYMMEELSLCCFIVIMMRKSVFKTIPLLDTKLKSWQDDNMCLNLNKFGMTMYHSGALIANIRRVDESISTNYWNLFYGLEHILKTYKNDIIIGASYSRYLLWKIRLLNNYFLANKYSDNNIFKRLFCALGYKCTYNICNIFFRHIYG